MVLKLEGRREVAQAIAAKLAGAAGPTVFLLPLKGGHEWDRAGGPLSDPDVVSSGCADIRRACTANVRAVVVDGHINDAAFSGAALGIVDDWVATGFIAGGQAEGA